MSEDAVEEICLKPFENGTRASWMLEDLVYQLETVEQTFKQFAVENKKVEHLLVEHDSCIDGKIAEYYKHLPGIVKSLAGGGMRVKKVSFLGLPPHGTILKKLEISEMVLNDGGLFEDQDFLEFLDKDSIPMDEVVFGNLDGPALQLAVEKLPSKDTTIELLQEKSQHGAEVLKTVMSCANACHNNPKQKKLNVSVNTEGSQKFEEAFARIHQAVTYNAPNYPEEVTIKYFVATKHKNQSPESGPVTITKASFANYIDEEEKWSSIDLFCQNLKSKDEAEDFLRGSGYDGEQEVKEKILKEHF